MLCIGSALVVGVRFPAWSAMLQSKSYGYSTYSDLNVEIPGAPLALVAGATTLFEIRIGNRGPDPAAGTQLQVMGDNGLFLYGSTGCANSRSSNLLCQLGTPIASDGTAQVTINAQLSPDARGWIGLGAAVGALSNDEQLEDNSTAIARPVVVSAGLALTADAPVQILDPISGSQKLRWQFWINNPGPSSERQLRYQLQVLQGNGAASVSCSGIQGGICPTAQGQPNGVLRPGARLAIGLLTPVLSPKDEQIVVQVDILGQESGNADLLTASYRNALFADGLE